MIKGSIEQYNNWIINYTYYQPTDKQRNGSVYYYFNKTISIGTQKMQYSIQISNKMINGFVYLNVQRRFKDIPCITKFPIICVRVSNISELKSYMIQDFKKEKISKLANFLQFIDSTVDKLYNVYNLVYE